MAVTRTGSLAYGALLLGLAIFKAIGYWKENGFRGSHLVRVIITDQIIYYLLYAEPIYSLVSPLITL